MVYMSCNSLIIIRIISDKFECQPKVAVFLREIIIIITHYNYNNYV